MAKFRLKKTEEVELEKLFLKRDELELGSDERKQINEEINALLELKGKKSEGKRNEWIAPTIGAVASLIQIGFILKYEEISCLTSKAINFVNKPKL